MGTAETTPARIALPRWLFVCWLIATAAFATGSVYGALADAKLRQLRGAHARLLEANTNVLGFFQVVEHRCQWAEKELKRRAQCKTPG